MVTIFFMPLIVWLTPKQPASVSYSALEIRNPHAYRENSQIGEETVKKQSSEAEQFFNFCSADPWVTKKKRNSLPIIPM